MRKGNFFVESAELAATSGDIDSSSLADSAWQFGLAKNALKLAGGGGGGGGPGETVGGV